MKTTTTQIANALKQAYEATKCEEIAELLFDAAMVISMEADEQADKGKERQMRKRVEALVAIADNICEYDQNYVTTNFPHL